MAHKMILILTKSLEKETENKQHHMTVKLKYNDGISKTLCIRNLLSHIHWVCSFVTIKATRSNLTYSSLPLRKPPYVL